MIFAQESSSRKLAKLLTKADRRGADQGAGERHRLRPTPSARGRRRSLCR